jgi:hypothetical protein
MAEAFLNLRQIATPNGNPQTGGQLLYVKSDGKVYTKSATGLETLVADVTLNGAQTLTNKTIALGSNTISGTTAQFNTALTDNDFATLAGSETLTNKTVNLSSNTLSGTTAQFNTALSDNDFATLAGTETLTNKTLSTGTKVGAATTDLSGAWAAYTPTFTNLTIGNATVVARYMQVGKTLHIRLAIVGGTTTAFVAAPMTASLPAGMTVVNDQPQMLSGYTTSGSNQLAVWNFAAGGSTGQFLGANISSLAAFTNGTLFRVQGTLELA